MNATARTYLTTGIAALGAGAIALTPIQPLPGHAALAPYRTADLAVELAAAIDPITPWVDTIKLTVANIEKLVGFYLEQPLPLLTTMSKNWMTYFQELPDIQLVAGQIVGNINTFFTAPWSPGDPEGEYISSVPITTGIPLSQKAVYAVLPVVLGDAYAQLEPIIKFTATPYSGQLAGLIGPLLAPLVQLTRSFTAIGQFVQDGDVTGAINELINIPANVTNAVLNGAGYLDLTGVAGAIAPLPPEVKSIGLNLGGLVSPPVPTEGTVEAPTAQNGGVMFDSLAAEISYKISNFPPPNGTSVNVTDPGLPVSWVGSVIGLGQLLGDQMLVTPPTSAQANAAASAEAAPKALADSAAPAAVADSAAPAAVADSAAPAAVADSAAPAAVADSAAPAAVADSAAPAAVADSAAPAAVAKAPAVSKVPAVARAQAAVAKARAALSKAPVTKRGPAASSTRASGRGLAKAAARHAG